VRETGGRVLQRHRARQAHAFLEADIRRHTQPANGWPARNIVDDKHRTEAHRWFTDVTT
jgi:hypothetical protein